MTRKYRTRPTSRRVAEIAFGDSAPYGSQWLLLDSHVWYWLLEERMDEMRSDAQATVHAAIEGQHVAISDASPWELLDKAHRGRLRTALPPRDWVNRALNAPGLRTLPLTRALLLDSAELPGEPPRDPFDRVIIASARQEGMTLVTADRAILAWAAATGAVRTLPAR